MRTESCRHCDQPITRDGHVANWWWHPGNGLVWCDAEKGRDGTEAVPVGEPCPTFRGSRWAAEVCSDCGLHPRFHRDASADAVERAVATLRLYAPHLLA